ncbi:hypothetical protein H4R19_000210 [Coemansia spiralis]|nr:hypothetical protein H4R19_000210 [Coemansia spiralis]
MDERAIGPLGTDSQGASLLPSDFTGSAKTPRHRLRIIFGILACVFGGILYCSLRCIDFAPVAVSYRSGSGHASAYAAPHTAPEYPPNHRDTDAGRIRPRPYKDSGRAETARLGVDHIYIVHRIGHPQNLLRMARVLQQLRISAEFVPVLPPPAGADASSVMSPEIIAEWHTRLCIYRDMEMAGYRSALILDDSIDMELNINVLMRAVHHRVPVGWDMISLGHGAASVHAQPMPAHAMSRKGLLQLLAHVGPAPSPDALSGAIAHLKDHGLPSPKQGPRSRSQ